MAVKTFEREVKKISNEFKNLIETYNFEQYDFHSIRQTLEDYIRQTYPNYEDYFRSDYVMMLVELFAYYGEMMAYKMDTSMNEAYLSTAKERKNIIKIADMLGYKFKRITPSVSINRIDISDEFRGSRLVRKVKKQTSVTDVLNKMQQISFEPIESDRSKYYPYKLDFLFKNITAEEFISTTNNIFKKLETFTNLDNVKIRKIVKDGIELYERSIFVDKFQMRFEPNTNVYVEYSGSNKMFEIQSLVYDPNLYYDVYDTADTITYSEELLYGETVELGFEFVLLYDAGNNIIDKNIYLYLPVVQGGSFTRPITVNQIEKNFKITFFEENIFCNKTSIKQFDENGNLIRVYKEVEDLSVSSEKYIYEINNTPEGHIELIFGDGNNAEPLLPASTTLFYYRKNVKNSDEIMNVKNAELKYIPLPIQFYDVNVGKNQQTGLDLELQNNFNAVGGIEAETDEQIKFMARKLRSIQDRFVTGADYNTAGLLHPRVKYSNSILRSYIGKNSSRISNEFIDIYFDKQKHNIEVFELDFGMSHVVLMYVPEAMFTPSTVKDKEDYITFVDTKIKYFVSIFDPETISPNDWYKYNPIISDITNKGKLLKIENIIFESEFLNRELNLEKLKTIFGFSNKVQTSTYNVFNGHLHISLIMEDDSEFDVVSKNIDKNKTTISNILSSVIDNPITDIKIYNTLDKVFVLDIAFNTVNFGTNLTNDFIWTHYKSDDIYLNPSKSNIIEIYVSAAKKDLQKSLYKYEPLSSSEITSLLKDIEKRKMISDVVSIYNANVYKIQIAIKVYRSSTSYVTAEMLRTKIDNYIDLFFDLDNIPLGKHFHASKLIEWLHKNISEIEHIEMLTDSSGKYITPSSTFDILGDQVIYTQIIEDYMVLNKQNTPKRLIEIII